MWRNLPVKGAFYMIAENSDLQSARASMRSVEDRFNHQFGYPWVILSSRYISPEFRKYITMITDAPVYFGKIDLEAWVQPHWVSTDLAEMAMQALDARGIRYGSSLSFRQRARYHAGFYFHHPLMQNVDYSWRVEPGSYYSCDLMDDPFFHMKSHNKTVGFVLTVLHGSETIMMWSFNADASYNFCHIQSSFQIINMAFLRSSQYMRYFNFIDSSGGFFYERWDEGTVLTMAASLFLRKNEVQFFNQMGFEHGGLSHCPMSSQYYPRCSCDIVATTDFNMDSCTLNLLQLVSPDTIDEIAQYTRTRLKNYEARWTDSLLQPLDRA
ncbi:nucleotide-diphospho-sugar transferase [Fennellomyces sp. T-0311]|nr:nucleotide-diphospho-sugar transferase [Fennellomyces sp. T-0311]